LAASKPDIMKNLNLPVPTLKKRADFLRLRKAKKYSCKFFTVQGAPSNVNSSGSRIGYTVTTKVGNSVERSRIKRRLREIARKSLVDRECQNFDYVVLARRSVLREDFGGLVKEFSLALDHLHPNGAKGSSQHA